MGVYITDFNACCNLGSTISDIYKQAIQGNSNFKYLPNLLQNKVARLACIDTDLPEIDIELYNTRCNQLILKNLLLLQDKITQLKTKYTEENIAVIVATTNSGVEEYTKTRNMHHSELGNPAQFVKDYLNLKNCYLTVSTACSSGIKAFSVARNLIENKIAMAVIVIGVDPISRVPLFGFDSLEVLSELKTNPLSQNRSGINIGEAIATFIVEKDVLDGIEIKGIGETTDTYHATTPDPEGREVINAIKLALEDACMQAKDIDYINLHGTGTFANDSMEANVISKVFGNITPASSTKPLTGHCLGAAASIEIALCCELLNNFEGLLYPHLYDEIYDTSLPTINLVKVGQKYEKCTTCMCNSFGFGGTNAIVILRKENG